MSMLDLVEVGLSWDFRNTRGRDEKSFYHCSAFSDFPQATIDISSPDLGPGSLAASAQLNKEHSADGAGTFPSFEWRTPQGLEGQVKEWLLVNEDPDAPLPTPIVHGFYMGISPSKTAIEQSDLETVDQSKNLLNGGFHYGQARKPVIYIPPKPLLNHGPSMYVSKPRPSQFTEEVRENLNWAKLSEPGCRKSGFKSEL